MQEGTESKAPSWKVVYDLLKDKGPLTTREIKDQTDLADRTVSFALRRLIRMKWIRKRKLVQMDQRSPVYVVCN